MILAAITVLYLVNVSNEILQWKQVNLLIGTKGESIKKDRWSRVVPFSSGHTLEDISTFLPVIVTDGILVIYSSYHFDSL